MLITEVPQPTLVSRHAEIIEFIRVIMFLEQFLRTLVLGGFSTQKALASEAPPQALLGELTALPQTP